MKAGMKALEAHRPVDAMRAESGLMMYSEGMRSAETFDHPRAGPLDRDQWPARIRPAFGNVARNHSGTFLQVRN
jgi:hypothetical protein